MGEVYRATDPRLKREVALKVLPSEWSADPDRLARFQREAELLASLNHPNIAQIYGIEQGAGVTALVMELVDGPTVADLIAAGPMSFDTVLPIATQIADALEAAHEQGIIHRDLKPANVKVRRDGRVKVLDFGLARSVAASPRPLVGADSPTLTSPARLTGAGMILGTAAYMAPEQARGEDAGRPADIWAFGCVLFEMLSGTPAFAGTSVAEIVSNVLKSEPDWQRLPVATPTSVVRTLRRCLAKDPKRRFQHAGDVRLELLDDTPAATVPVVPPLSAQRPRPFAVRALPWAVAAAAVLGAVAALVSTRSAPVPAMAPVTRLDFNYPPHVEASSVAAPSASLSPDGRRLVFTGQQGGFRRLYVRDLDQRQPQMLVATDASSQCFFSPDGTAVTYVAGDRTIRRLTLTDGLSTVLMRGVDRNVGASWGSDGFVTYVADGELWQVPGDGGRARKITTLDRERGELFHAWPAAVPDSHVVLFTVVSGGTRDAQRIDAVDPSTGERHTVIEVGSYPMIAREGPIVFQREGVLVAAPIDRSRLAVAGPAVAVKVLDDVALDQLGAPLAALSASGGLVYVSNEAASGQLVWVNRQGATSPASDVHRVWDYPRFSPDGARILTTISGDLWQVDPGRSTLTRVTTEASISNSYGVYTPDGERIIFRTALGMRIGRADGGSDSRPIPGTSVTDFPHAVTNDGKTLVFTRQTADAAGEVYVLSLEGDPKPHALFTSPAYEGGAVLSPDNRWVAYASNESGRYEIYVRPFPEADTKRVASTDGGNQPMWGRDGKELFYRSGSKLLSVPVTLSPDFAAERPREVFDLEMSFGTGITFAQYDVAKDGRFLMIKRDAEAGRLNVVLNWTSELAKLTQTR